MMGPVVVVGGGLAGSAIALELQRRDVSTILIDRNRRPGGASALSFASLSALDEDDDVLYGLKRQGMAAWRRWQARSDEDLGLRWEGQTCWAEDPPEARRLDGIVERARRRGYAVVPIDAREVAGLQPWAAPQRALTACHAPGDGQVELLRALGAFRRAFARHGGVTVAGRARLRFGPSSVAVALGDWELDAARVVVAAGNETAALLARFGWELPMDVPSGLLAVTGPVAPIVLGTVYVAPASGPPVRLRRMEDGRVMICEGLRERVGADPTSRHALRLLHQAQKAFPRLAGAAIERLVVERRPMPSEGLPLVGPLPGVEGVYITVIPAGVTSAPFVAELVAAEVADGTVAAQLEPLRPSRGLGAPSGSGTGLHGTAELFFG